MLHRISIPLALALMTACSGHLNVGSSGDTAGDSGEGRLPTGSSDAAASPSPDGAPAATIAQVSGALGGQPFTPAYAIAFKGVNDPAYPNQISVFITDINNLCALAQTGGQASFRALVFVLGQTDSAAPPVGPGTYTQGGSPNEGTADYYEAATLFPPTNGPEDCGGFLNPVEGNIVISSVGTSIAGMFDGTVGSEQPVTVTFDAPLCDVPEVGAGSFCL
jgi:hypothetical protein